MFSPSCISNVWHSLLFNRERLFFSVSICYALLEGFTQPLLSPCSLSDHTSLADNQKPDVIWEIDSMTSCPVEEIKDCCPRIPVHAVHMSWTRNQRKNNCSIDQPTSNPGQAKTKESRCVPFFGMVSHNPMSSTITAWVQKVARRQEFELAGQPTLC